METTADSSPRQSNASSSPDFEFWMLRNPPSSDPKISLLSADKLFSNGILLPLQIPSSPPPQNPAFDKNDILNKRAVFRPLEKKERKFASAIAAAAAEINIKIWPFSRSRSSGNGRRRVAASFGARKTCSAPCSRCESRGKKEKSDVGCGGCEEGRDHRSDGEISGGFFRIKGMFSRKVY